MNKGNLIQNGVHLQEHEYSTIKALLEKGLDIELIPPSSIKGIFLPDIYINGVAWEIKAPEGNSKQTIRRNLQCALRQSQNVILDLRRCKLNQTTAINNAKREFYLSKRARKMIIIIQDDSIADLSTKKDRESIVLLDYSK